MKEGFSQEENNCKQFKTNIIVMLNKLNLNAKGRACNLNYN